MAEEELEAAAAEAMEEEVEEEADEGGAAETAAEEPADNDAKAKDLEDTRRRIALMAEEEAKLTAMHNTVAKVVAGNAPTADSAAAADDGTDETSIYVGQVDYEASPEELQAHFMACGTINRVTILCDKHTGSPKGYAYIEFATKEMAVTALAMNDSVFRGRNLKVTPKRQNIPGMNRGRGRGRGRGAYQAPYAPRGGRGARGRGRGGSYRGGGGGYARGYHPYY